MRYLYKTLLALGAILLISLLKRVFDHYWPGAGIFHHNMLASLQLLLLLWLVFTLGYELVFLRRLPASRAAARSTGIFLVLVLAGELTCSFWLHHPRRLPRAFEPAFVYYYYQVERNILQFNPDGSVYDSSLYYTLKPGERFVFDNYEFRDSFRVNRLGLRDSDSALAAPQLVCLGDSYTMGWGLQQEQTISARLAEKTGWRTLNAGVSSYGTVRELKNWQRLDSSNLKAIVLQYCRNDYPENRQYVQSGYRLPISSRASYDSLQRLHYWSKAYFPGKHLLTLLKLYLTTQAAHLLHPRRPGPEPADTSAQELKQAALTFVDVMAHSRINFAKTRVWVYDMNEPQLMDEAFINQLEVLLQDSGRARPFRGNLRLVPVADLVRPGDYRVLDYDHPGPGIYERIAARLADSLRRR